MLYVSDDGSLRIVVGVREGSVLEMGSIISGATEIKLAGRAFLYQLMHAVFSGEPDDSLFDVLAADDCLSPLREMSQDNQSLSAVLEYCNVMTRAKSSRENMLDTSRREYNRCIAGLGSKRKSHPWESTYTNNRKLLFQVETLEVRNAYREFGYLPQMYPKVADDHISLECAFLAALAGKMIEAGEAEDAESLDRFAKGSLDFLNKHLLLWIDLYAKDLHVDAPDGLYDCCAHALADFARSDKTFLEAFLDG